MILRRFRKRAREHDWFSTLIDLVILVLGVFLGIQVSNWNQARSERRQSHEDRQRLIADLNSNEADYKNRGDYFRAVQVHAQAALDVLADSAGSSGEQFLIDAYQATQIVPREAKHVTYDEIVASGRLTRLGDPVLRDRVGNYYIGLRTTNVTISNVPPYREQLRRAMPGIVQIAIRSHCPEQYDFLPDGTALTTLASRCTPLGLDAKTIGNAVRAVRAIPGLKEELNRVVGDSNSKLELLSVLGPHVSRLRAQIAAADR